MSINDPDHLVRRIAEMKTTKTALSQLSIYFFTVRKQRESDHYYRARESSLSADVQLWLKKQIIHAIRNFRKENDMGEKEFQVSHYNFELQKNDTLARLQLEQDSTLYGRKEGLLAAIDQSDAELADDKTHFQLIGAELEGETVYCCYYRKPKRSIGKKKFAFKNSGELQFTRSDLIEIGGPIDFFIVDDSIFISNLRSFEYAFDYQDHINELRDRNLEQITQLPLFDGEESNPDIFEKSCRQYVYSRSLAQIQPETLQELQQNFDARCEDLKIIRSRLPEDPDKAEEYIRKYSALWELYDFIDLQEHKVRFYENQEPKTLIRFFSDKIVQSFLTGDFEVAVGYEQTGPDGKG